MITVLGWALLLVLGVLSLPLAAFFLDGSATEGLVLPAQLVGMALIGGLTGMLLPGFVTGEPRRQFAVGAACGLATSLVGAAIFFVLLNAPGGA